MRYKVGDKVVPISKSISGGLSTSSEWKYSSTGFLYITGVSVGDVDYICCHKPLEGSGDYFMEADLVPYVESSTNEKGNGFKETKGKVEYSQIPPNILEEVAWVLTEGAEDHGSDTNWQLVPDPKKAYYNSAMRHIQAWQKGEKFNVQDHGRHHLAYAIANLIFLMWHDTREDKCQ